MRMADARIVLVLSENWTLVSPRDLPALIRIAVEAEQAVAVHVGEARKHLVRGGPFNCSLGPQRSEALALRTQLTCEALKQRPE